jgi:hypothetical protein
MFIRTLVSAAIATAVICVPAVAAAQTAAAPAPAQPPRADPNERICETITMTGSRLNKKRFCASRAEWQEMRLRDRQEVERAQMSPCVRQTNAMSGKPSC